MEAQRLLITGGFGFIGSALIRLILQETSHRILNLDALTYAANLGSIPTASENPRYCFLRADVADPAAVRKAFDEFRPHAVLHLAAETHVDRSIDGPLVFMTTNIMGTFTLLQEARRYWTGLRRAQAGSFRFLHVSTDEVFGSLGATGAFTEESAYRPNSPYSASKAAADHLVRAWHHTFGLPVLITNCSNNYGPYHHPEKLIPHTIIKGLLEQPLTIYGDGQNVRDWLYVEDHARALLHVLAHGSIGESYNIGGRNERTNLQVAETICDLLDEFLPLSRSPRRELITLVADRPGHDRRYAIDPEKIESKLGWTSPENFEEKLAATVLWYIENQTWWQSILKNGYQANRIGVQAYECPNFVPALARA
jgi:dTDP-glucose 4,6-dehydratase